jgi:uncharacterized RDD family membrane protein YckC
MEDIVVRKVKRVAGSRGRKQLSRRRIPKKEAPFKFSDNEAAPPKPPASTGNITEGAGFGIRLLARLLDTVYGFLAGFFAGICIGILLIFLQMGGVIDDSWREHSRDFSLYPSIGSALGMLLYHVFTEGICGASMGKLICGLRVITTEGLPCGLNSAFKRSLLYYWDGLFFGLVGYYSMEKSNLKQRYGDAWARTIVVKSGQVPPGSRRAGWIFVLALALGSFTWALLLMVGILMKVL